MATFDASKCQDVEQSSINAAKAVTIEHERDDDLDVD